MSAKQPAGPELDQSAAAAGPGRELDDHGDLRVLRARDAFQRGWQAHLLGDRVGALLHLEAAKWGVDGIEERDWPLAMFVLSLYAFTQASIGCEGTATAAAQRAARTARAHDPSRNTPRAIRLRLASRLPSGPPAERFRECLERWALAVAYRLPSTHYRLAHESDLNRLRAARLSPVSDRAESLPG